MTTEQFFPTILICLDVAASMVYLINSNWRLMLYWFAAAVLTACVTF